MVFIFRVVLEKFFLIKKKVSPTEPIAQGAKRFFYGRLHETDLCSASRKRMRAMLVDDATRASQSVKRRRAPENK